MYVFLAAKFGIRCVGSFSCSVLKVRLFVNGELIIGDNHDSGGIVHGAVCVPCII